MNDTVICYQNNTFIKEFFANLLNFWHHTEMNDLPLILNQMGIKGEVFDIFIVDTKKDCVHFKVFAKDKDLVHEYHVIMKRGNMTSPYPGFAMYDGKILRDYHWDYTNKKLTSNNVDTPIGDVNELYKMFS